MLPGRFHLKLERRIDTAYLRDSAFFLQRSGHRFHGFANLPMIQEIHATVRWLEGTLLAQKSGALPATQVKRGESADISFFNKRKKHIRFMETGSCVSIPQEAPEPHGEDPSSRKIAAGLSIACCTVYTYPPEDKKISYVESLTPGKLPDVLTPSRPMRLTQRVEVIFLNGHPVFIHRENFKPTGTALKRGQALLGPWSGAVASHVRNKCDSFGPR